MNYNKLKLINNYCEVIESEMMESVVSDEMQYFDYLTRNLNKSIILDLLIQKTGIDNAVETMRSIVNIIDKIE